MKDFGYNLNILMLTQAWHLKNLTFALFCQNPIKQSISHFNVLKINYYFLFLSDEYCQTLFIWFVAKF